MDELRLIGVHEDGEHLLLRDADGDRFRLRIDDAVRAAVRRDRPRLGQLQIEIGGGVRPREVQALIRAGATAREVSERTGWPLEKVERYEGPILAEREHVAGLARAVRLRAGRGRQPGSETLGVRVAERIRARGVETSQVEWDAHRSQEGAWLVTVSFPAGGRERIATWSIDLGSRTVEARDDEARWLSEDDPDAGPIPSPHAVRRDHAAVYDVEAEGGVHTRETDDDLSEDEPIDLMSAIREHSGARGRRRGARRRTAASTPGDDSSPDDALPLDQVRRSASPPPAAAGVHPLDEEVATPRRPRARRDGGVEFSDAPRAEAEAAREAGPPSEAGVAGETADDDTTGERTPPRRPRRKGRPSVPAWDDVMFGSGQRGS